MKQNIETPQRITIKEHLNFLRRIALNPPCNINEIIPKIPKY
jgi:hypothetical protein